MMHSADRRIMIGGNISLDIDQRYICKVLHNVNFWILIGGNISVDWRILVISVNLFTVVIIEYRYMIIYVHWYNVDCPIFMGGNVRPLVQHWWSESYIRNYVQYTYSVDHRILTGGNAFPLVQCWWFSPVSSTNITNCNDITEILLKMALNTITLTPIIPCCWAPTYHVYIL